MKEAKQLFKYVLWFTGSYFIIYNIVYLFGIWLETKVSFTIYIVFILVSLFVSIFISVLISISRFKKDTKQIPTSAQQIKISLMSILPYWLTSVPIEYFFTGEFRGQLDFTSYTDNIDITMVLISIGVFIGYFLFIFSILLFFFEVGSRLLKEKTTN